MGLAVLEFKETSDFFERLDANVKNGNVVTIKFISEKPDLDSKLWKRLRKVQNWDLANLELKKVENRHPTPLTSIASSRMVSSLTGGEVVLLGWIATLLTGLFTYAIYKGRSIRFKANESSAEIIIE